MNHAKFLQSAGGNEFFGVYAEHRLDASAYFVCCSHHLQPFCTDPARPDFESPRAGMATRTIMLRHSLDHDQARTVLGFGALTTFTGSRGASALSPLFRRPGERR